MLHPPRTKGTVLTDAFGVLPYVSKDVYINKHADAIRARSVIGEFIWNSPNTTKICLDRDEETRNHSWYKHINNYYDQMVAGIDTKADTYWLEFVKNNARKSKEEFYKNCRLPPVRTYCNTPEFRLVTVYEAYRILVSVTGYDPGITVY